MRISNEVDGKEGRVDKGQTSHVCELCSDSVIVAGHCGRSDDLYHITHYSEAVRCIKLSQTVNISERMEGL